MDNSSLFYEYLLDPAQTRAERETREKREALERAAQQQQQQQNPLMSLFGGVGGAPSQPQEQPQGGGNPLQMLQTADKVSTMSGGEGIPGMGYVAPAMAFYKFVDTAHDQGWIDKNTEVIQDSTQWMKQPFRWATDVGGNALSKLKFW